MSLDLLLCMWRVIGIWKALLRRRASFRIMAGHPWILYTVGKGQWPD